MAAVLQRQQTALPAPVAAPVGGLNARDALAAMPENDASVMVNLFPHADRVETRPGFTLLSTATLISVVPGSREGFSNLMVWGSGSAGDTLFATYYTDPGSNRGLIIYSVASDGTLTASRTLTGAPTHTSIGEWTQFGSGSGTNYLILAVTTGGGGAAFTPQAYDGSSWATLSITGVPLNTLGVHSHRNRLWFYNAPDSSNALLAYYLPTASISGTVATFNLAPYASKGGRIVAMRTWTQDGGVGGSDDLAVFFTNRGQAIVYAGTDPSSAATWALVGVFDLGIPASYAPNDSGAATFTYGMVRDSFCVKYGADLLFLMQSGVTSAQRVLRPSEPGADYTLSGKINPLLTDASRAWVTARAEDSNLPNWKVCHCPGLKALFVCVPTAQSSTGSSPTREATLSDLYVMNAETGAWTKYSGINVRDMVAMGSNMYFTDGTERIFKYDGSAATDNGTAITFECRQAYNYMNSPANKLVTLMQPMLRATGNFSLTMEADADFNGGSISTYTSYTVGSTQNLQPMLSPNQYGRAFAAHLKGQTSVGVVSWYATNWIYKPGRLI